MFAAFPSLLHQSIKNALMSYEGYQSDIYNISNNILMDYYDKKLDTDK